MSDATRQDRSEPQQAPRRRRRRLVFCLVAVLAIGILLYLVVARPVRLDDTYGRRRGTQGGMSVNGSAVLGSLFHQRGSRVRSWKRLSPRLRRADTVVWIPDDFEPPTSAQRQWFVDWLAEDWGRTLVYIGRDYDAEITYWEIFQEQAEPQQAELALRRLAAAKADHASRRLALAAEADGEWFRMQRRRPQRTVSQLIGPWSKGIDAEATRITLSSTIHPTAADDGFHVETLLATPRVENAEDPDILVSRLTYEETEGQIIIIHNGSFLLNLPLVNRQHRMLAAKLIDECGEPQEVVFLESDALGPPIIDTDDIQRLPGALAMMSVWPLGAIVTHLVALGIILCFALFPIFGHPRTIRSESRSDFAKHVRALGRLLAKTEDYQYANEQLQYYLERVKRESGSSHSTSKTQSRLQITTRQDDASVAGQPTNQDEQPQMPGPGESPQKDDLVE